MSDERKLIAEIQRYIDSEKAAAGPDIGTTRQGTEDACRAARIAAFASVLYLIEEGWLGFSDSESDDKGGWAR